MIRKSKDISWLKYKSLGGHDNLPDPDVLLGEIIKNLKIGLASFREIVLTINGKQKTKANAGRGLK